MTHISNWKSKFIFVKESFLSEACPDLITSFRHDLGTFSFQYPNEPVDEILCDHIIRHPFEAQTFPDHILYLTSLASSWEEAPSNPLIFIGDEEMSFKNFLKLPDNRAVNFSASPTGTPIVVGSPSVNIEEPIHDEDQDEGFVDPAHHSGANPNVMKVKDDDFTHQNVGSGAGACPSVADRLVQMRLVTITLEEGSSKRKQVVVVVGSSLKPESKKRKQDSPKRGSSRRIVPPIVAFGPIQKGVDVQKAYDAHILLPQLNCLAIYKRLDSLSLMSCLTSMTFKLFDWLWLNMQTNESRIMARDSSKLKDKVATLNRCGRSQLINDLRSKSARLSKELGFLREVMRSSEGSWKALTEENSTCLGLRKKYRLNLKNDMPPRDKSVKTEFPAIVFNDNLRSNETLSCEPMVTFLKNNETDFRISFDESDDEDYTIGFDKNLFSYKIISTNDLKMDSENDKEKVNMPLFPSPEPLGKLVSKNGYGVLGKARRSMTWRQFILALGLHTNEEMAEDGFGAYWLGSERVIPDKGDLSDYWVEISFGRDFLTGDPSYTYIRDSVRRLCHRLISYNIFRRGRAPEKVTVTKAVEDAHVVDEGALAVPAPIQAPQPQPPPAAGRTML
nr:hypothetical protein [Tanacetum cinerariifolium]